MRQLNCLSPALCRFSCCCCCFCSCYWSTHAMRSHKALSYLWGKSCLLWITIQSQVYLLSYSLKWSTHWVKRSLCLERQLIFVLSAFIIDLLSSTDLQVICVTDQHQNRPLIRWSLLVKQQLILFISKSSDLVWSLLVFVLSKVIFSLLSKLIFTAFSISHDLTLAKPRSEIFLLPNPKLCCLCACSDLSDLRIASSIWSPYLCVSNRNQQAIKDVRARNRLGMWQVPAIMMINMKRNIFTIIIVNMWSITQCTQSADKAQQRSKCRQKANREASKREWEKEKKMFNICPEDVITRARVVPRFTTIRAQKRPTQGCLCDLCQIYLCICISNISDFGPPVSPLGSRSSPDRGLLTV